MQYLSKISANLNPSEGRASRKVVVILCDSEPLPKIATLWKIFLHAYALMNESIYP